MTTLKRILGAVLLTLGLLAAGGLDRGAGAHIVPPERLHPVAESYRRLAFTLNLNPIPWQMVRDDLAVLQTTGLTADARSVLARGEQAESSSERKQAAEQLLEEATRSVVALLTATLEESKSEIEDYSRASASLAVARQIWAGLEPAVKATDPAGFRRH